MLQVICWKNTGCSEDQLALKTTLLYIMCLTAITRTQTEIVEALQLAMERALIPNCSYKTKMINLALQIIPLCHLSHLN